LDGVAARAEEHGNAQFVVAALGQAVLQAPGQNQGKNTEIFDCFVDLGCLWMGEADEGSSAIAAAN